MHSPTLDKPACVALSPTMRLQWEPAQRCHVLLYPEGIVQLNDSAAVVLKLCDGTRNAKQIVEELCESFGDSDVAEDVMEFLSVARSRGWILDH